jgi:membrane associated rhomboid family serine protease
VVIVAFSLAAFALPPDALALRLAKDNGAIRDGEVWRLVTVALVHGSLLHLFFNAYFVWSVGRLLERLAGAAAFLTVLVAGTAAGGLLSFLLVDARSVGASGGAFAIVGAVVSFGFAHRTLFPPAVRGRVFRAVGELLVLNLVITFAVPGIDWAGHVGGLVAGAALGLLLLRPSADTRRALAPPAPWGAGPGGGWPGRPAHEVHRR